MDLYLHLGAHRTGSTTLQIYARHHARALRSAGVEFWGPLQIRDGRMEAFFKAADQVTPAIAKAGRATCTELQIRIAETGANALLISDENLLGSMFANVRDSSFYDDAARRLARLRPAFEGQRLRIGLAIRSYDRHWASSLGYVLQKQRRGTSQAELASLAGQPRRWRDVITEIAAVYPDAEIVVWPFEALVDAPGAVLRTVIPALSAAPLQACAGHHHPSLSCADLRKALPYGCARESILGEGAWSPFDADTRAQLRAEYAADIAWLRAGANNIARYFETEENTSPECIAGRSGLTRGTDHDQRQRRVG
ncbi:MAG: hypothetical protein AAGA38_09990 [Pseudomonadota bacterium]